MQYRITCQHINGAPCEQAIEKGSDSEAVWHYESLLMRQWDYPLREDFTAWCLEKSLGNSQWELVVEGETETEEKARQVRERFCHDKSGPMQCHVCYVVITPNADGQGARESERKFSLGTLANVQEAIEKARKFKQEEAMACQNVGRTFVMGSLVCICGGRVRVINVG